MTRNPTRTPNPPARLLDVPRSLLFYIVFYGGTVTALFLSVPLVMIWPRLTRLVCDGWSHYHRWCTHWILGIRVRVEGVQPAGPYLVVGKHESFFEAIDMPTLFVFPSVFAKAELMRLPLWGRYAGNYGLVGVERDAGAKALRTMLAAARAIIAQDRILVLFAEGTRVPHLSEPPLQSGFAGIYKLLGLTVVPMAVDSGRLYHRTIKRRGTVTYRFGEPIPPGLPREEAEARVHAAINALNREDAG